MSFILDALRKSENERQQQAPSEFATAPSSSDSPGIPRWLWILAALLAINLIVLFGLLMRPDKPPQRRLPTTIIPTAQQAPVIVQTDDFTDQVAVVREEQQQRPLSAANAPLAESSAIADPPVVETPAIAEQAMPEDFERPATDYLPTLTDLRLNGRMQLPDLHIDIHVFAEEPRDRFVFINMSKYKERETLGEGPIVNEITRDGVVLEYRGIAFLLPRD